MANEKSEAKKEEIKEAPKANDYIAQRNILASKRELIKKGDVVSKNHADIKELIEKKYVLPA